MSYDIRDIHLGNVIMTFRNSHIETTSNVCCNVIVEWLGAGVIGFKLDDGVAVCGNEKGIAE
jgi:hypothetical protein